MSTTQIEVAQAQFDRIEAAWEICSYGNGRKATGAWVKTFRDCVREVIGSDVPAAFSLKVA